MLEIYTSGVANNVTKIGACSIVVYLNGEPFVQNDKPVEFARRFDETTNMQMLQMAIIGAIKCCPTENVTIYTPNEWSAKVGAGISRAKAMEEDGDMNKNDELWLRVEKVLDEHIGRVVFSVSKQTDPGYKRAHKIAKELL